MRRHLRLLLAFWSASVMRGTELRASFFTSLLDSSSGMILSILFLEIIYSHVNSIGGWGKHEVLLLLGVFFLQMGLLNMIVKPGFMEMGRLIRWGDLDGSLLKPISSQFLISFFGFDVFRVFDVILALVLVVYSLSKLDVSPTAGQWLIAAIHFAAALVTMYSIWFISLTVIMWTTVLWSWEYMAPNMFSFGQYPAAIYKGKLKLLFMSVVPIAVLVNFPVSALIGNMRWISVLYSVGLAAVFLLISIVFWKKALRYYSSASS